jgi:predicted adenylyl cyclase CyaB
MSYEIEKNFYIFDEKNIKEELKNLNTKYKIHLLKTYKTKVNGLMVRLRDEGFRKTFTIKHKDKNNNYNKYNKEYEVNVSNIEETLDMLELLGFSNFKYSEKIRETYFYKNSEICFDYVPGQCNFIQIESKSQNELDYLINKLNLKNEDDSKKHAEYFGINKEELNKIEIKYINIDKIKKLVKRNDDEFDYLIKKQKIMYIKVQKFTKKTIKTTNKNNKTIKTKKQ